MIHGCRVGYIDSFLALGGSDKSVPTSEAGGIGWAIAIEYPKTHPDRGGSGAIYALSGDPCGWAAASAQPSSQLDATEPNFLHAKSCLGVARRDPTKILVIAGFAWTPRVLCRPTLNSFLTSL